MSEDFPKIEPSEGLQRKPVNFFEMDEKGKSALKERISAANGTVRIFVHPYWSDYSEYTPPEDKEGKPAYPESIDLKKAEEAFKRIISDTSKDTPPVVLLLNASTIDSFSEEWVSLASRPFYVVPTLENDPAPITPEFMPEDISERGFGPWNYDLRLEGFLDPDPTKRRKKMNELEQVGWERLISQMKELGVRKVLVGGMEFYAAHEDQEHHGGCAGATVNELRRDFNVDLSALSWPQGRKEVKQAAAESER